jgi:hypothetical protein
MSTDERPTGPQDAVARRTPTGWRVGDEEVPDLTSAMVLADLLAADLPSEEQWQAPASVPGIPQDAAGHAAQPQPGSVTHEAGAQETGAQGASAQGAGATAAAVRGTGTPGTRKRRARAVGVKTPPADTEQLKETVAQLERALTVRVRVEQAIGVLAERHKLRPRQAFELLRSASRARGARVSQTAVEVVASATNPLLRIPEELARQPEGARARAPRRSRRNPDS